jgi:hypothetical protein
MMGMKPRDRWLYETKRMHSFSLPGLGYGELRKGVSVR